MENIDDILNKTDFFREVAQSAFNHIVITDTEGLILFANGAAERMTGYSFEEMHGKTPRLWGQQMSLEVYKSFWDVIKTQKLPFHGELLNKRKNGQLYNVVATVSPILDKEGKLIAFLGLEEDITEKIEYEDRLVKEVEEKTYEISQKLEKIQRLEKEKDEFIRSASHQLRTPITTARIQIEQLETEAVKQSCSPEILKNITLLGESNLKIVDILLDLFKVIELGGMYSPINLKRLNLKVFIQQQIDKHKKQLQTKKTNITLNIDDDILILISESDLKYILTNLIDNAITYTNDAGEISIMATKKDLGIHFTISDNGIGIPEKDKELLFTKFFRAKNSYLKKTVGTGLGLTIIKKIISGYKGTITFTSTENEGSIFTLFFPDKES